MRKCALLEEKVNGISPKNQNIIVNRNFPDTDSARCLLNANC